MLECIHDSKIFQKIKIDRFFAHDLVIYFALKMKRYCRCIYDDIVIVFITILSLNLLPMFDGIISLFR